LGGQLEQKIASLVFQIGEDFTFRKRINYRMVNKKIIPDTKVL